MMGGGGGGKKGPPTSFFPLTSANVTIEKLEQGVKYIQR